MRSEPDLSDARAWVVRQGLSGRSIPDLLGGAAEHLVAAGLPVWRAHVSFPTVSPRLRGRNIVWTTGCGMEEEGVDHERFEVLYRASPFPEMLATGRLQRRWRLQTPADAEGFPLLRSLEALGATDHLVWLTPFDEGTAPGVVGTSVSFTTRRPGGFSDPEVDAMTGLVPLVALAIFRMILSELAVDVLGAYLGRDAGQHVLGGAIRRGHGNQVRAALMFADLHGFTAAADAAGAAILPRLGEHLAAMAEPVEEQGGEVLKFLGDGLLAAFPVGPDGREAEACSAALRAALEALRRNTVVDAERPDPLGLHVALHLGDVFYGNIGAGSRLDFTVIGPAVNEASRIEALCGPLGIPLLMSDSFAAHCGARTRSLGEHDIRGLVHRRELLTVADDRSA